MNNIAKRGQDGPTDIYFFDIIYTRYLEIFRSEFDTSALRFKRRGSLVGPVKPVYNSKAKFIDWWDR